jgi:GT2 family glycosyltransferase
MTYNKAGLDLADSYSDHRASGMPIAQSDGQQPCVYVVLLNWNGWKDTVECIESLRCMQYRNWRAVIVDNGSTDGSIEQLKDACPDIPILTTGNNLGFAAGNNVGIRFALKNRADYVLFLNNDTILFPATISKLVEVAEKHPDAALMGPRIDARDPQREWSIRRKMNLITFLCTLTALRRLVVRTPLLRDVFYCTGTQPSVVYAVIGSALFFRAEAFEKIGLFDESTFLDYEELIMAEKVRSSGFSAYFVPQAVIWHKGSASAAKLRAKRYVENAKSEQYFFSNYVRLSPFARLVTKLIRFLTYGTRALLYRNYREHFNEFMDALLSRRPSKLGGDTTAAA